MINRLRKVWRALGTPIAAAAAAVSRVLDKEDVLTLAGLALIGAGFWLWSRPLALIVPGAILLWMFLPSRPPFVDAPAPSNRVARRPPS